jgi:hypothetical protein
MPHFNQVFKEFGIHHEYEVLVEVIMALEKEKKDVITKNMTTMAEVKKRKGDRQPRLLPRSPGWMWWQRSLSSLPLGRALLALARAPRSFHKAVVPIMMARLLLVSGLVMVSININQSQGRIA